MIGVGLLAWLIRKANDYDYQKPILIGLLVTDFGGFLVMLDAQLTGLMNTLGWTVTVPLFLLSAALLTYVFLRRKVEVLKGGMPINQTSIRCSFTNFRTDKNKLFE